METNTAPAKGSTHKDVYSIITDRIIEQLEKGTVPWQVPWTQAGIPRNLISQRPYRGINVMLLAVCNYEHNLFLTSKQLKDIGGSIKSEEKPHLVVFWNYMDKDAEESDTQENGNKKKKVPYLGYYTVFNISQCEGIPEKYLPQSREPEIYPQCEDIIANMPKQPKIQFKEQQAYYDPLRDYINMPKQKSFKDDASYYSTLFHELMHSTGHRSRLNRQTLIEMAEFGSDVYSQEELVAEIGTCYLQSIAGITAEFENSAAYVDGWLKKLKGDKKFIFSASTNAQKATDFILGIQTEHDEKLEE